MKILTINYEFPPLGGGASPVSYEIAKGLAKLGHQVDVVTMGFRGLPQFERRDGINIYRVKCWRAKKEMTGVLEMATYLLPALIKALRLNRENHYDINHTHFIIPSGIVSYLLKKLTGLKYIITSHGSDVLGYNQRFAKAYPLIKPVWKTIIKKAELITTPSKFLKEEIERIAGATPFQVIPNGIEPGRIEPLKKEKYILLVSRLFVNKGIQDFFKAIRDLGLGDWQVKIAGDGPYRKELFNLRKKLNLQNRVEFLGWVDNQSDQYRELFGRAGIFVCPSWFENMSVTLIEAAAAGCQIIATDAGGNREVIGGEGGLVSAHCPEELAEKLKKVLALSNSPRAVPRNLERFYWDNVVDQYQESLKKAKKKDRSKIDLKKISCLVFSLAKRNLLWIYFLLTRRGELLTKTQGGRIYLPLKDVHVDLKESSLTKQLAVDDIREEKATRELSRLLKKGDRILEVGANIGYYVILESQLVGPGGKIYAVEPEPNNIKFLKKNIKLNNIGKITRVYQQAISNQVGQSQLHISEECNLHTLTATNKRNQRSLPIQTTTIDHFLRNKKPVDFIRMDIEGYEYQAIEGVEKTLAANQPLKLFIELHPHLAGRQKIIKLLKILRDYRFEITRAISHDTFIRKILGQAKSEKLTIDQLIDRIRKEIDQHAYEVFFSRD